MKQCEHLWRKVRDTLWRGHAEKAIELARTLAASLLREHPRLLPSYALCAGTCYGATTRLLKFLIINRATLPNYQGSGVPVAGFPLRRQSRS